MDEVDLIMVVDVETTGLVPGVDVITEIGAVVLEWSDLSQEWRLNGQEYFHKVDTIFGNISQNENAGLFRLWIAHLEKPILGTSYNKGFDQRFLDRPPWCLYAIGNFTWDLENLCVMMAVKKAAGLRKPVKLEDAVFMTRVDPGKGSYHTALFDARAAGKVLEVLLREGW